ncbi:DUF58 domain-containing protein [Chloroflexota bacterium]
MKLKHKALPFVVLFLIVQEIVNHQKAWLILLLGLGGALGLGYLWARSLMKGLHFERERRFSWAKVGDRLQERFELKNNGRFPAIWVTVVDHSDFPGYQVSTARFLEGRGARRWLKGNVCYTRGLYSWGPTDLETGDPFGIFQVRIHYADVRTLLVIPPVIPLPSIEIASGDQPGEGGTKAFALERTITAATVRDYVPGDDLHSIHWLTSARRDDLFVRVFDQTPTSDWWILMDMQRQVQIGEAQDSTHEYAVILAASIADRGLRYGRAVGLVAEGQESIWLPPQTGSAQRWEILRSLATVRLGELAFDRVLANTQRALGRNSSVIVVTPSLDQRWLDALVVLRQRNVAVTVLLQDPQSFGGQQEPDMMLARLKSLGINYHRITPDIYQMPSTLDYFVWRKSPHGRSSSVFTVSDLDWGKL